MGPFAVDGQVPINARVFAWLAEYDPSSVRLTKDGREIPVLVEPVAPDVPGAYWVSPSEPIESLGVYALSVGVAGSAYRTTTYFGGTGSYDNDTPQTREARPIALLNHEYCAEIVGTAFDLGVAPEVGTSPVFEVEVLRAGGMVEHTFTRTVIGTSPDASCFGESHVDGLREGEALTARARAWDSAGNVSDFVTFAFTPARALAGSDEPCGRMCSVAPARPGDPAPPWVAGLSLLAGVGFAARRARARRA